MKPELVRAARALLNWSQQELADNCGMDVTSIRYLETGKTNPSTKTVQKIETAFERASVGMGANGVKLIDNTIYEFKGDNWYLDLLDDVYETLMDQGGEFLVMFADDALSPPEVNARYRKIRNLGHVKMRQLIEDGNEYILGAFPEYKYVPSKFFSNNVILIYGDKVAECTSDNTKAVVFNDEINAAAFKNIFEYMWTMGQQPEKTIAKERF